VDESTLRADQQDTTYIINTESGTETARLIQQAREVNRVVGLFPMGMDEIREDATLLDIGSGTGDWCLDVAFEMPRACVIGIDLSQTQVEYATARARTQLLDNISFEVLDALTELQQWPAHSYDYVHLSLAVGWVPGKMWLPLLSELHRLLKPGGWFISVEGEWPYTTSSALNQLNKLLSQAMHHAGIGLAPDGYTQGVVACLGNLLYKAGFTGTRVECHALDFSGYRPREFKIWLDDFVALYQLVRPFVFKHVPRSEEMIDFLYDEMLRQMWEPDFCGVGSFYTYYAQKL